MKVSDLLESRRANWRELEELCRRTGVRSRRRLPPGMVSRFSTLYRAACADLALAHAYQLPPGTVHYLHQLVGRAHNQLYRSRTFRVREWIEELFVNVPQRLFADNCLRLAFLLFWGTFLLSALMAYYSRDLAERMIGEDMIEQLEDSYASAPDGKSFRGGGDAEFIDERGAAAGMYAANNPSIGLRCFVFGLFIIGGIYITMYNASMIGAAFGYMASMPDPWRQNFFYFVTAHGPFELTAVVLCSAAGLRLGFSIIDTQGYTRAASLRRAAFHVMPTVCAAVLMFLLAALIEAFLSPSAADYGIKASVAILSAAMLLFYFVVLGYPRGD